MFLWGRVRDFLAGLHTGAFCPILRGWGSTSQRGCGLLSRVFGLIGGGML